MDFQSLGKVLVVAAVALAVLGGLLWAGGALGLGRLPGDVRFSRGGWSCAVPLVSSLILSILLTLLLNLLIRLLDR
jgi:hypothetical protein